MGKFHLHFAEIILRKSNMIEPIQISYRCDLFYPKGCSDVKPGEASLETELIVGSDGSYCCSRYNDLTEQQEMLSGRAPLTFFSQIDERISEEFFDPLLAERIGTLLVDASSEVISRMTLQKNYGDAAPMKQTVLMWDIDRYGLKVPQELYSLELAIDSYIEKNCANALI